MWGLKYLFIVLFSMNAFAATTPTEWKGIFLSGDDSIQVFDNARTTFASELSQVSKTPVQVFNLSATKSNVNQSVALSTVENITTAFEKLNVQPGQGCLIYFTSHGAEHDGFYLAQDPEQFIYKEQLQALVNQFCGNAPTVIMISACFSGQFITDQLKGDNRVILTAAREDRTSFGCSSDEQYTYWDECMLNSLKNSDSFRTLYQETAACVDAKEKELGVTPSLPQASFGKNMDNVYFH